MTDWKKHWNFRPILTEHDSDPAAAARGMQTFLEDKLPEENHAYAVESLIDQFHSIGNDPGEGTYANFDIVLNDLFDYCDDNSIWVPLEDVF